MKKAILMLRENSAQMSGTEREAAEYILKNLDSVPEMNMQQLAQATFTSPSTIYRMCKELGFTGYKDFKKSLIYDTSILQQQADVGSEEILPSDSIDSIIEKVTRKNIVAVEETKALMDPVTVSKCVDLISGANTVLLFGIGASFCAAKDMSLKLLRINKPCSINEDWHSQLLMARNSRPDDIGIVISYSGETREIIKCMEAMRENDTPIIAITRFMMSHVAKLADYKLYTAANEAVFRSGAMSSRMSQLDIIDILYTAYVNSEYEYTIKQFSKTYIVKDEL